MELSNDFLPEEYKTNKIKALTITSIIYLVFLALLYFIKIVYEPKEELEALGVDLNYGVDLVGSGNLQTLNRANDSKVAEEMKPDKGAEKPVEKLVKPAPAPKVKETAPKSEKTNTLTADEDTKVVSKKTEAKTPPKAVTPVKTEEAKPAVKAVEKPSPPSPPARNVDNGSIFKKNPNGATGSNGTVGTKAGVGGNNNGDGKPGEVGDKGDPRGTLDGKSLYGNPGKGGGNSGASVSISGWKNKGPLNIPKDNSSETGKIVFEVTIDDYGDVVNIKVKSSSLSPSLNNYYKNQISQKLKSNLVPEGTPPPRSTGTITINITRAQ